MRALSLVVAFVLAALAAPGAAAAQLAEARAMYADGALDRAQRAYEVALTGGALEPAALAEVELYLGVIARAASDPAAMRAHFERAVAIDPTVQAPSDLPPRGRRVLEAARAARSGAAITVRPTVATISAEGPVVVNALVEGAPSGLVTDVRFTLGAWSATVAIAAGAARATADVWPSEPGDLVVEALTATRNVAGRAHLAVSARPAPALEAHPLPVVQVAQTTGPRVTQEHRASTVGAQTAQGDHPGREGRAPDDSGSIAEEPAFWIVLGLVVVGAVVGVALALTLEDSYVVGVPRVEMLSFP